MVPANGGRPKSVQLRPMARKWGSCSTAGRVTFDTSLLRQHAEFRKRVIVEELLHLRIPNHGKLFKALLQAFLNEIDEDSTAVHRMQR